MNSSKLLALFITGFGGFLIGGELIDPTTFSSWFGIILMTSGASIYGRLSANDSSEHH